MHRAETLQQGSTLTLQKLAVISSDGRGCLAGEGGGRGESRPYFLQCGGAGGSNFGEGGSGAKLIKTGLSPCAQPGRVFRLWNFNQTRMPMVGAAGGGCAVPDSQCKGQMHALTSPVSAGGSSGLLGNGRPTKFQGKTESELQR